MHTPTHSETCAFVHIITGCCTEIAGVSIFTWYYGISTLTQKSLQLDSHPSLPLESLSSFSRKFMPQCRCSDSQLHEAVILLSIIFPKTEFWDPGTAPTCALHLPTDHQDLLGAHTEQERRPEPVGPHSAHGAGTRT